MNSKVQLGWSNTFTYKNFSLYFLINGKFGGKVISFTEAELDRLGLSQRTANAHADPENNNIHVSVWRGRENVMQFHIATGMNSIGETRTMIVLDHCSHYEDNDIYCNCLDIFLPRQ